MNYLLIILILLALLGVVLIIMTNMFPNSSMTHWLNQMIPPGSLFFNLLIFVSGASSALVIHKMAPKLHSFITDKVSGKSASGRRLINS